jgi:hypothetical protein
MLPLLKIRPEPFLMNSKADPTVFDAIAGTQCAKDSVKARQ